MTIEVLHYGQRSIGHIALYLYPLYNIHLVDCQLLRYGYTNIQLHAASGSCCFRSYGRFLYVHHGSYFQWLHLQRCGGVTGVRIVAVCQRGTHWMKRPSMCSIRICSHLAELFLYPSFAGVELERKMMTKRSGKS